MVLFAAVLAAVPLRSAHAAAGTIDVLVSASTDDAEENSFGEMYLTSSDLELTTDSGRGVQTVGFRFASVDIPQGATITNASVTFEVDETSSESTNLQIAAERSANAATFTSNARNLSSRSKTNATVAWSPGAWRQVSDKEVTPDLSSVVQEITNRLDWRQGNALAFIVTGTGKRVAESYDGERSNAPRLRISYETNVAAPPTPVPVEKLDTPVVAPGSVQGENVIFNWSEIDDRVEYHVQYTLPNGQVRFDATPATRYPVPINGEVGDFCLVVRAVAPGRDSDLSNRSCATVFPPFGGGEGGEEQNVEAAVVSSSDDAEERATGSVSLTSSDLELTTDSGRGVQTVGMRFGSVDVPAGATITNAIITFETDETSSESTNLTFAAQAAGNPPTFTTSQRNLSFRPRTNATVRWAPPAWNTVSQRHDTPDLSRVVQEVVDRGDWRARNAMVFLVTGTGKRVAESYDGERNAAPRLKITYTTGAPAVPAPTAIVSPRLIGDGFTTSWRTADPDAGQEYEVQWALDGVTFDQGGRQSSGASLDAEPPASTGQVCGQARTHVDGQPPSDWSSRYCFQFAGAYDPPTWTADPVTVVGSTATVRWTRASRSPSWAQHQVRWTKDGYTVKTELIRSGQTSASHTEQGETARLCATIETFGSGNRLSSVETEPRCGNINPLFSVLYRLPVERADGLIDVPIYAEPGPDGLIGFVAVGEYDPSMLEVVKCDPELNFTVFSCVPNDDGAFSLLLSDSESGTLRSTTQVATLRLRPLRTGTSFLSFEVESGNDTRGLTHGFGGTVRVNNADPVSDLGDWDGTTEILENSLQIDGGGDIEINAIEPQQAEDGLLYGDVDCSGEREIRDALIMIQVIGNVIDEDHPDAECFAIAADINRSGGGDEADVQLVLECLIGFGFSECDMVIVSELVLNFRLTKPQIDNFQSEWTVEGIDRDFSGLSISANTDGRANIVMMVTNGNQRIMFGTDCACDTQELTPYDLKDYIRADEGRDISTPSDTEGVTWMSSGSQGGEYKHTIAVLEEDRNEINIIEFCETCAGTKIEFVASYLLAALPPGGDALEALVYAGTDVNAAGLDSYVFFVGDEVTGTIHRVLLPIPLPGAGPVELVTVEGVTHSWDVTGGPLDEVTGLSTVPGYEHVLVGVADDGDWPDEQPGFVFAVDLRDANGDLMDAGTVGSATLITAELGEELVAGRRGPFHQPEGVVLKTETSGWIATEGAPSRVGSIVADPQ